LVFSINCRSRSAHTRREDLVDFLSRVARRDEFGAIPVKRHDLDRQNSRRPASRRVGGAVSLLIDGAIVAAHATRSSEPAGSARMAALALLKQAAA